MKLLTVELAIAHHVGHVLNAAITTDRQPIISAEIGELEPSADKCASRRALNLGPRFAGRQNLRTLSSSLAEDLPVRLPMPRYKTIRSDT